MKFWWETKAQLGLLLKAISKLKEATSPKWLLCLGFLKNDEMIKFAQLVLQLSSDNLSMSKEEKSPMTNIGQHDHVTSLISIQISKLSMTAVWSQTVEIVTVNNCLSLTPGFDSNSDNEMFPLALAFSGSCIIVVIVCCCNNNIIVVVVIDGFCHDTPTVTL